MQNIPVLIWDSGIILPTSFWCCFAPLVSVVSLTYAQISIAKDLRGPLFRYLELTFTSLLFWPNVITTLASTNLNMSLQVVKKKKIKSSVWASLFFVAGWKFPQSRELEFSESSYLFAYLSYCCPLLPCAVPAKLIFYICRWECQLFKARWQIWSMFSPFLLFSLFSTPYCFCCSSSSSLLFLPPLPFSTPPCHCPQLN